MLDEGLYLYKGFIFVSGRYTPFQNYGPLTNQMPFAFLLWQLILGGVLSGVTVMIRIDLLPLPFFLVLYILWQYGWKKSLWVALAGVVTVVFSHALFWPNILRLWTYWLPENLTPFLDPWRQPAGASPFYDPAVSYLSRGVSFINAFRFHFTAFIGALLAWAFWPRRTAWKSDENFRVAVFLSVLFISLIALHGWASLGKNYCTFCFPIYASFFSGVGLLLVAVSLPSWQLRQPLI